VLLGLRVAVLLGHAEIDHVNDVGGFGSGTSDQEVIGLDIAVDEILLMNSLHSRKHLLRHHDNGLDGESATAVVEQILQRRAKKVDHQDVVQTLLTEVVDVGDAS